jgi:hypothetical protein
MLGKTKVNIEYFILFCIIFRFVFLDLNWLTYAAMMLSAYQFCLIFVSVNYFIPIRYLSGLMMCLQILIGPALAYNGLDIYQEGYNKMQISEQEYFAYAFPAVLMFIIGLNFLSKKLPGEKPDLQGLSNYVKDRPVMPYTLIVLGFISSLVSIFFSSDLAFVFLVLSGFKFVGIFLIILGNKGMKPLPLVIVYGSIISSSIAQGMFFDLLTWLIFLGSIYAIKFKPNNYLKVSFILLFSLFSVVIQQLKGDYREATWKQGEEASVETVKKSLKKKNEKQGLFSAESLGASNLRINQGYIITNIMKTVPDKIPYENGAELELILESSILPRIIAPNKLNSGDRFIFMKYSGIPVAAGTSMALSSVGDAYINYGPLGGAVFMFFFGLLFNYFLKLFNKKSKDFPIAILLATVAFYYPIRPDCELQTILGHLFKSTIILFVILSVWKHNFKLRTFSFRRKTKEFAF